MVFRSNWLCRSTDEAVWWCAIWAAARQKHQNHVRPAKMQISLGVRPESSLSAWRNFGSLATHWAHSEDWSDWAETLIRLGGYTCWSESSLDTQVILIVLSCCGSFCSGNTNVDSWWHVELSHCCPSSVHRIVNLVLWNHRNHMRRASYIWHRRVSPVLDRRPSQCGQEQDWHVWAKYMNNTVDTRDRSTSVPTTLKIRSLKLKVLVRRSNHPHPFQFDPVHIDEIFFSLRSNWKWLESWIWPKMNFMFDVKQSRIHKVAEQRQCNKIWLISDNNRYLHKTGISEITDLITSGQM